MTAEKALYERDPEAWNAHLAEGNARQARKRISVDVLIRDEHGRVLLVDPNYKPDWDLPGGMAEPNEPLLSTARRELREELGLQISPGRLLGVEWVAPHGPWDDLLNFIFDGGVLDSDAAANLRLADEELQAFQFCDQQEINKRLRPYVQRRVEAALEVLNTGRAQYFEAG